jgi:hypothetical protein
VGTSAAPETILRRKYLKDHQKPRSLANSSRTPTEAPSTQTGHNTQMIKTPGPCPKLDNDPNFRTFVAIAQNANSTTTPASVNGGAYQLTLQDFGYANESGKQPDLAAGLKGVDTQVDKDIAQAK